MRPGYALSVAAVLAVAVSGSALSSSYPSAGVGAGGEMRDRAHSPALDAPGVPPAAGCPDIGYSDTFKSNGLGYVSSEEFSAALHAVASGDSRYSPDEIPPDWAATAAHWGSSSSPRPARDADPARPSARASVRPEKDGESCSPSLVYLASMEYRLRVGRPALKPAFPVFVREATRDLVARADAKRELAARFAERTNAVAAKIRDAERMGAGDCAPGTLAAAKAELDRARREAAGVRSSVQETESSFVAAERFADTLLAGQRLAFSKGLRCYKE